MKKKRGDNDVKFVIASVNVEEAITDNMPEERVAQDIVIEQQGGGRALVPKNGEFALPEEEEKYKRLAIEDWDNEAVFKSFNRRRGISYWVVIGFIRGRVLGPLESILGWSCTSAI